MARRLGDGLGERAVAIVDVEVVVPLKIVRDVQVRAAVAIEIARHDAQPESIHAPFRYTGRFTHVSKAAAVVPVQAVSRAWIPASCAVQRCRLSARCASE